MVFEIDKTLSALAKESAQKITKEMGNLDNSMSKSEFSTSDFASMTHEKLNNQLEVKTSSEIVESIESNQYFAPEKFNQSFKSHEVLESDLPGLDNNAAITKKVNLEGTPDEKLFSDSTPAMLSNITFGNHYDDRAVSFLNDCRKYNIDLPTSVTHAGTSIDRHNNGGFVSIDKALMETSLKNALNNGKITKDVHEQLHNKLMSC